MGAQHSKPATQGWWIHEHLEKTEYDAPRCALRPTSRIPPTSAVTDRARLRERCMRADEKRERQHNAASISKFVRLSLTKAQEGMKMKEYTDSDDEGEEGADTIASGPVAPFLLGLLVDRLVDTVKTIRASAPMAAEHVNHRGNAYLLTSPGGSTPSRRTEAARVEAGHRSLSSNDFVASVAELRSSGRSESRGSHNFGGDDIQFGLSVVSQSMDVATNVANDEGFSMASPVDRRFRPVGLPHESTAVPGSCAPPFVLPSLPANSPLLVDDTLSASERGILSQKRAANNDGTSAAYRSAEDECLCLLERSDTWLDALLERLTAELSFPLIPQYIALPAVAQLVRASYTLQRRLQLCADESLDAFQDLLRSLANFVLKHSDAADGSARVRGKGLVSDAIEILAHCARDLRGPNVSPALRTVAGALFVDARDARYTAIAYAMLHDGRLACAWARLAVYTAVFHADSATAKSLAELLATFLCASAATGVGTDQVRLRTATTFNTDRVPHASLGRTGYDSASFVAKPPGSASHSSPRQWAGLCKEASRAAATDGGATVLHLAFAYLLELSRRAGHDASAFKHILHYVVLEPAVAFARQMMQLQCADRGLTRLASWCYGWARLTHWLHVAQFSPDGLFWKLTEQCLVADEAGRREAWLDVLELVFSTPTDQRSDWAQTLRAPDNVLDMLQASNHLPQLTLVRGGFSVYTRTLETTDGLVCTCQEFAAL
jgi:hypothetical protein